MNIQKRFYFYSVMYLTYMYMIKKARQTYMYTVPPKAVTYFQTALSGNRIHDILHSGQVLYQLSLQGCCKFFLRNIHVHVCTVCAQKLLPYCRLGGTAFLTKWSRDGATMLVGVFPVPAFSGCDHLCTYISGKSGWWRSRCGACQASRCSCASVSACDCEANLLFHDLSHLSNVSEGHPKPVAMQSIIRFRTFVPYLVFGNTLRCMVVRISSMSNSSCIVCYLKFWASLALLVYLLLVEAEKLQLHLECAGVLSVELQWPCYGLAMVNANRFNGI